VVVDAAMNDFMRPALYGATHPITRARRGSGSLHRADIVGPVCESGDCFVQDWPLGEVAANDVLVLWERERTASSRRRITIRGASRRSAHDGRRFRVIRRRESLADLVRGE